MTRETRITVASDDMEWIVDRLVGAGLTVLDTGERITTDEGLEAEAVLHVAAFEGKGTEETSKQGPPLRP